VAVATPAQPASQAVRGRARRQREEELLVWPDLVFVEFISAVVFTITFTILAVLIDGILLDRANPAVTPNPSKAPWYFLNLQELLLHMHPALAGVIVPTVALIALGAIPYFDTSNEGQGQWFATPHSVPLAIVGAVVGAVGSLLLIFYDAGKHVELYELVTGQEWPEALAWLTSLRALQTEIAWPDWITRIPLGSKVLRTDLLGLPPIDLNVNVPAVLVEQIIPTTMMIGLPLLLALAVHKVGLARTRRDHMIVQFTGFIAVYVTLTIVGTYFRGAGLELVPYTIFVHE
jgi:menaquinol-cytochrome c reductase cytochrome b/c subunit